MTTTMMPSNAPNVSTAQMMPLRCRLGFGIFFLLNFPKWTNFSPAPHMLCGAGFFSTLYQPPIFDP